MKIGIIGTGHIGKTLTTRLSAAGHQVKVANSRGPETIGPELLAHGAQAVTAEQAVADVEVIILSIPLEKTLDVAPLFNAVSQNVVVIDTSNYFPYRTGKFDAIEAGQVESEWVEEQLGRSITKAWNAIGMGSFAAKSQPSGTPGRIAIPVAGDDEKARQIAMSLVNDTGFDAVDAGLIKDSWRQQPGAPGYCTDLTKDELVPALAAAERERLPKRRELTLAVMNERFNDLTKIDNDYVVRLGRAIYM